MRTFRNLSLMLITALGLSAVLAACATRPIPYAILSAKYSLPSSQYFETEQGLKLHYTDEGEHSGLTVVLVHGFAASVHAWRPWINRLGLDYRFVAIDLPGHGLTEAPKNYESTLDRNVALVETLADRLNLDRFVLGGNSMGGAVALNYALAHPERLDGLVLVDAAGWPGKSGSGRSGPPLAFRLLGSSLGRAVLKAFDPRLFARGGLKAAYLDETLVTDVLIDRYAELALAPGHRDILITQDSRPGRAVTPDDIGAIAIPTLILAGTQDKIIPVEQSLSLAKVIPGSKLVLYPEGGHVPMEQLPDASARDLKTFLDGLQRR